MVQSQPMNETRTDQRRMVLVLCQPTDTPEHTEWKCPVCFNPVTELVNLRELESYDVFDPTNPSLGAVGRKCGGRLQGGGKCRLWYYFSLSIRPSYE